MNAGWDFNPGWVSSRVEFPYQHLFISIQFSASVYMKKWVEISTRGDIQLGLSYRVELKSVLKSQHVTINLKILIVILLLKFKRYLGNWRHLNFYSLRTEVRHLWPPTLVTTLIMIVFMIRSIVRSIVLPVVTTVGGHRCRGSVKNTRLLASYYLHREWRSLSGTYLHFHIAFCKILVPPSPPIKFSRNSPIGHSLMENPVCVAGRGNHYAPPRSEWV